MTIFYIDPVNGSPYNDGLSALTPLASLFPSSVNTAVVTGYIGTSSDGGVTITSPSNILTVTAVTSGNISAGRRITGTGVTAGSWVTNSTIPAGGIGTYTLNQSQSVTSTTLTVANPTLTYGTGHTYLLKRGTTFDSSCNSSSGGVLLSGGPVTIDAYGTGAIPIIASTTGKAFSIDNRNGYTVSNISTISSASNSLNLFNTYNSTFTDCQFSGVQSAVVHAVGTNVQDLIFLRCSFNSNSNAGVASAFFSNITVASCVFTNMLFDTCKFIGCQGTGLQLKSGDGVANSYYQTPIIRNSTFTDNAVSAIKISTGDLLGDTTKWAKNVQFTNNIVARNLGPGTNFTALGGYIAKNTIFENNNGTITGSGGLCFGAAQNMLIELNNVYNNHSGHFAYDGAGIYLDQLLGNTAVGSSGNVIRKNLIWGHKDFSSSDNTAGNLSSCGIKLYHSDNNHIHSNICYNNHIGIDIDSWSASNRVHNNTCINNDEVGIATAWNMGPTNNFRNNIIIGSAVDISASSTGNRTTTGNITLSATGTAGPQGTLGIITVTSTVADFASFNLGYAIKETSGPGWGYVSRPVSQESPSNGTKVTVAVIVPFSSTTYTNGNWTLTYGTSQVGINDYNLTFNSTRSNGGAGAAQVLANLSPGTNDIVSQDPKLDQFYRSTVTAVKIGGKYISAITDYYGKEFQSPPSLGAVQSQLVRAVASTIAADSRYVTSNV